MFLISIIGIAGFIAFWAIAYYYVFFDCDIPLFSAYVPPKPKD